MEFSLIAIAPVRECRMPTFTGAFSARQGADVATQIAMTINASVAAMTPLNTLLKASGAMPDFLDK
jgi:hypothetical protein